MNPFDLADVRAAYADRATIDDLQQSRKSVKDYVSKHKPREHVKEGRTNTLLKLISSQRKQLANVEIVESHGVNVARSLCPFQYIRYPEYISAYLVLC